MWQDNLPLKCVRKKLNVSIFMLKFIIKGHFQVKVPHVVGSDFVIVKGHKRKTGCSLVLCNPIRTDNLKMAYDATYFYVPSLAQIVTSSLSVLLPFYFQVDKQ